MGYRTESHDKMNHVQALKRGDLTSDGMLDMLDIIHTLAETPLEHIDLPRFERIAKQKPDERSREDERYYQNFCTHDTMTSTDPPTSIILLNGEAYKECADCDYSRAFDSEVIH